VSKYADPLNSALKKLASDEDVTLAKYVSDECSMKEICLFKFAMIKVFRTYEIFIYLYIGKKIT